MATLTHGPYPNQSFLATFDLITDITGTPAAPGFMAFCLEDNKIYIYNGSAWRTIATS